MATVFFSFSKKAVFILLFLVFSIFTISGQKGPTKPSNPKKPINSALDCPLVVSIQDNNPAAECSELLKTLVAITSACTDTTAVSYEWSSSIGGVFSTSRTTTFNLPEFIVATPLTINVLVTEGSDSQSASYTFTIKPRPSRPSISPVGALILCDNNPITLTTTGCVGGSTPIWSNGNAGLSSISVPAIGGTFYKVACEKNGCVSDSTAAVSLVTGILTPAPAVTNRTICEGTTITTGNGLLAEIPSCGTGATGTFTYSGPLVGYDDGYRNTGGIDPTVSVPTSTSLIKKLSVSITWRKQKGGFQNSCSVGDTESNPYHNETQFRIKSPSGKIITLVNTDTYGGYLNPTVTTVFEDGSNPINFYSPPVSGTFAPAQPLSGFIGENPTGTWTLLPFDDYWKDPLCVSGFSITFTADQGGVVTWWDAPTGGNLLHTGSEYIPTSTTPGTYTYYAQGQCVKGCPSIRTASTLTINPRPAAPAIDINVPEVSGTRSICGGQSITLTATGCPNDATVKWSGSQSGANFATGASHTFTPIYSSSSDINQTFTAVCTGANLCNSVISNTITLNVKRKPSTPTISGPGSTACINSNITLFASACSGGTLGWTGNRTGSSITFPITTNVDIKVACTVNGCTSDSSSVYSISTLPKPSVPTVNASQVQAICIGGSVTLSANGCINGGVVKWTGGLTGSSIMITPTSSKGYRASCLGTNGCASDSSAVLNIVVLPKTKPIITGPPFVCNDSPITLSATGCTGANETVMWRDQSVGLTYSDFITQTKTFRAVCIRNGYCVSDSSDVFTVQYRIKPSQPTITPPQNSTVCQGNNITLSAFACTGGTLNWTGGLTGNSIIISSIGTKSFKVACTINGCTSDSSAVQMITINPKPSLPTISSSGNIVCQPQTITLTASACTNGTLGWTGGLTGQSIQISSVGTKNFKVACTINGCTSDSSFVNTIQIKPKPATPTITPPPNATVCQGNNITLSAFACTGGTLNWTGGLTGNSITISSLGTKSFKVACTINGCTSDSSAVQLVTINPKPSAPTISSSGNIVCQPQTITLTASACTNGTLGWTGGLTGQSIQISSVGTKNFKVACTINGCTSDSSLVNTIQIKAKPAAPTITPPPNATVCQGNNITLTASACTGGTLNWTGGLTGNSIAISSIGTKSFKVACTINGCTSDSSAVQTVTINPKPSLPTISSSGNIVCQPQTITLTASACTNGTLGWTGGLTGQSIQISSVGTKNFKVACTINGCTSDSSSVNTIQIKLKPSQPTITPPQNSTVCQGNSITLSASACTGGTLIWTGGLTGNSITISSIGTKSFRVACTINGCNSDSSVVQTVTINPLPVFSLGADKLEICAGESSTISATGCTGTLTWSNNAGNVNSIIVSPTITSNYTATCTQIGCSTTQQITITRLQTPRVTASGPLVCDQSITLTAQDFLAGSSIQWRKDGIEIVEATGTTLVVSEAGNYDFKLGPKTSTILQGLSGTRNPFVKFINANVGYYLEQSNILKKTLDGGKNWTIINLQNPIENLYFIDANNGWASIRYTGTLVKTIDGGNNWISISSIPINYGSILKFKNNLIGVASNGKQLFYTNDGGLNWSQKYSSPNQALIYRFCLVPNSSIVYATLEDYNNDPKLLKSIDNGQNWILIDAPVQSHSVYFYDSNIGFLNSSNGYLYKTINGGTSWYPINSLNNNQFATHKPSFEFINNNVGYMSLENKNKILKTKDGGESWFEFENNSSYQNIGWYSISFTSEDNGWYAFEPDGNNNYPYFLNKMATPQCQTIPAIVAQPANQASTISVSADKSELCAGESATITSTACNGTLSWSNGAGNVLSITVSPSIATTYTATCSSGACTKTAQVTITPLQTPLVTVAGTLVCGQSITLTAENYPSGSTIQWRKDGMEIAGATSTTLVISEAGNYDFIVGYQISNLVVLNPNTVSNFQFLNPNLGFIVGYNYIKKTTNGGSDWTDQSSPVIFDNVYFLNENIGWAYGNPTILKTIDGGTTWESPATQLNDHFRVAAFKNNLAGMAISITNIPYFTTDGGITWLAKPIFAPTNIYLQIESIVYLPNSNTIYATANLNNQSKNGVLFKSIDGGNNWTTISGFTSLYKIVFNDQNNGWMSSNNDVYKTINGGNSWVVYNVGSSWVNNNAGNQYAFINQLTFVNNNVGFLSVGYDGIYKTDDGGITWHKINSIVLPNQAYLNSISFLNEKLGWYFIYAPVGPLFYKISTPKCPTTPTIVSPIPRPGGALVINTFKSGAWTDASTWNCGFIPSLLDDVIINSGHTITDNGNLIQAKKVIFNGNGTLQMAPTTTLKLGN